MDEGTKQVIKDKIEKRLQYLQDQLVAANQNFKDNTFSSPLAGNVFENIASTVQISVQTAVDENTRTEIVELKNSLAKLNDGDYDICDSCGGTIAPKRVLNKIPLLLCLVCQEKKDALSKSDPKRSGYYALRSCY